MQILSLVMTKTDELALGETRTTEIKKADIPSLLNEEIKILYTFIQNNLP